MYSKTPTGRNPKGTVTVITSNSRLQFRFRYLGSRKYISLGLPNTLVNRKAVRELAAESESE